MSSAVGAVVSRPGAAIDSAASRVLSAKFGFDLSHVRVHVDGEAAQSARHLDAAAYTVGHHVVFGAGRYQPRSGPGMALLTHEIAHVARSPSPAPPRATVLSNPQSALEMDAAAAALSARRRLDPQPPESGVVYRAPWGTVGEMGPSGVTTAEHDRLRAAAGSHRASDMEFGFSDVLAWKTDPRYLDIFKDSFVHANRVVITAAAAQYDIPAELLAGVVRIEIGGKDPLKPLVYQVRNWVPFTADRDTTSLGQQAIQPRRAAESLGYDPLALTDAQNNEILRTLRDPTESIFLAANHLSDLRDLDFAGTAGRDLTSEQVDVIGARYNQGPTRSLEEVRRDLSYGRAITRRWSSLRRLLTTPPEPLEYAPIQNSVVAPAHQMVREVERGIYRLYGAPY